MCKENISEYNPMELWLKLIDAETEKDLAELEKALNNELLSINFDEEKNNHCIKWT